MTTATAILLKSPPEVLSDDNVLSSHELQDEDLLGAIRPYVFELSDSVSETLRLSAALEADEEEDRPPDNLSPSQIAIS